MTVVHHMCMVCIVHTVCPYCMVLPCFAKDKSKQMKPYGSSLNKLTYVLPLAATNLQDLPRLDKHGPGLQTLQKRIRYCSARCMSIQNRIQRYWLGEAPLRHAFMALFWVWKHKPSAWAITCKMPRPATCHQMHSPLIRQYYAGPPASHWQWPCYLQTLKFAKLTCMTWSD